MIEVTFIRHGQVPGNELKQYIGITDQELSETGIMQAKKLHKYYEGRAGEFHYPLGKLYVSPLRRCIQTAEIVFPQEKQIICNDLREMDFGIFEGKSYIDMENDEEYRNWVDNKCMTPVPGGENTSDFLDRCRKAFLEIADNTPDGEKICVVAHGGTIAAIISELGEPKKEFFEIFLGNCEVLAYVYEDGALRKKKYDEKFFQNRDCKYFPCHEGVDADQFNCMFCYCPLYYKGAECGGKYKLSDSGIKSCVDCDIPHHMDSHEYIIKQLKEH